MPHVASLDGELWDGGTCGRLKLWDATDRPLVMFVKLVMVVSLVTSLDMFCGVGLTVEEGPVMFPPKEAIILLKESMSKLRFTVENQHLMQITKKHLISYTQVSL